MKVGFGSAKITPAHSCIIAGCMPFRPAHTVHDDVFATAMVIGTGSDRFIWVSCDICHPTAHLVEDAVAMLRLELPGFDADRFILNSTHATACFYLTDREFCFSGQRMPTDQVEPIDETRSTVCRGITRAVKEAVANVRDCGVRAATLDILTGFCRRVLYADGTAEMYGDVHREDFLRMEYPDGGPSRVLYFTDAADGSLTGIFANVPCPSQADESSLYVTADYWGVVRTRLREAFGENVRVLATCRAAGELSPHRLQLSPDSRSEEWGRAAAERLGNWIADHVIAAKDRADAELPAGEPLRTAFKWVDFPVRQPTASEQADAEAYFADPENFDENGVEKNVFRHVQCAHVRFLETRKPKTYRARVTVVRLGSLVFFTAPAELYTEYAARIAARFPDRMLFDVQLAQDCLGYLPTAEAIRHGGYSAQISATVTDADGGELYVRETAALIRSLLREP